MLTVITGAPGSGKSAALVDLLRKLSAEGRSLYVNGIPDLKVPHIELTDAEVLTWHTELPDGAVVIIDEVQRVWRPRGTAAKVPPYIAALETHRHRGFDFFLITQHPGLIDANVRKLTGRHVHLRDLGWPMGRYWYEWPECNSNPSDQWKQAPIKKAYKLPKAAFGLYKSASLHVKPIRSIPRSFYLLVVCVPLLAMVSWRVYARVTERIEAASGTVHQASGQVAPGAAAASSVVAPVPAGLEMASAAPVEVAKPVKLLGCIAQAARCWCVGDDGRIATDVPQDMCERNSERSGAGVPYAVGSAVAGGVLPARPVLPVAVPPVEPAGPVLVDLGGASGGYIKRGSGATSSLAR